MKLSDKPTPNNKENTVMTANSNLDKEKWNTVLARISRQESGQQDALISSSRLRYLGHRALQLPSKLDTGYKVVNLTDHSMNQMLSQTGVPTSFIDTLEQRNKKLATEIVNDALQDRNVKLFWRFSEDRVRGVLPERTPSVDNLAVVEAMDSVLSIGNSDFVVKACTLDDNRFYLKLLFDAEYRDQTGIVEGNYMKIGVVCRTSETHHGHISIKPFVYRWSCTNDAVVSTDHSFETRNFEIGASVMRSAIRSVIGYARHEAQSIISNMMESQSKTIRRPQAELQRIGKEHNMSTKQIKGLIRAFRLEPMPTQFGIAQAFTRYAQSLELDQRDAIEVIGGTLLNSAA